MGKTQMMSMNTRNHNFKFSKKLLLILLLMSQQKIPFPLLNKIFGIKIMMITIQYRKLKQTQRIVLECLRIHRILIVHLNKTQGSEIQFINQKLN